MKIPDLLELDYCCSIVETIGVPLRIFPFSSHKLNIAHTLRNETRVRGDGYCLRALQYHRAASSFELERLLSFSGQPHSVAGFEPVTAL